MFQFQVLLPNNSFIIFPNYEFKIIMIPTLIIAWIVFTILWKIVKTTVSNALTIAAIIVLLQVGFGITPQDIWHQIIQFTQTLSQIRVNK
ncbi:hypothetical protein Nos7107_0195 [Nostoc sp. PCC 7107]|nr:hypothetical protein Nos7107_0195 [Nostoc sp. PCC 7107]